jgi:hypothetical protein
VKLPAKLRIRAHEQILEGLRQYYRKHPCGDFTCEDGDVMERAGNCLARMKELDVEGNFVFHDGLTFFERMMANFTPDISTEHPDSKLRALHDLTLQQWLITLVVYRMSEGASKKISMETVYAEARKFLGEAQSGRSFHGKPRKRQKVWEMLDQDELAFSPFEASWKVLLDKHILAPWLPVYRTLDPKGVGSVMLGHPADAVVIDSSGFITDPPPLGHRDQVIRGLTCGTMAVIRNLYDAFRAKHGPLSAKGAPLFGPNPFASLPPQYLQLVNDVEP